VKILAEDDTSRVRARFAKLDGTRDVYVCAREFREGESPNESVLDVGIGGGRACPRGMASNTHNPHEITACRRTAPRKFRKRTSPRSNMYSAASRRYERSFLWRLVRSQLHTLKYP